MARISGINIPLNKRVEIGLTYIYGIGRSTSNKLLGEAHIEPDRKVRDLTEDEVVRLRDLIDNELTVEGDLRRERSTERQAPPGDRLLPRPAPPSRPAGARPEYEDQRAHAQGSEADAGRGQEEGGEEVVPAPRRPQRGRRRVRKNIPIGQAHIKTSFNNTIVSLSDQEGNVIAWESAGGAGFKGSRKSTPFAAQVTADAAARKGIEHGLQKVQVFVKGPGSGRETAIRSLQAAGLEVLGVKDVTPQAHNGCRPRKRRRV